MSQFDEGASRVGRPRDPSVERRVLEAARQELAEGGVDTFSMRSVARRANVSRPSLMLRWPEPDALIVDALDDINEFGEFETTGSLRSDLLVLVDQVNDALASPLMELQMRLWADAARRPDLLVRFQSKVMRPEFERFHTAIQHGVARGEVPPETDHRLLADMLVGVMFVRMVASPRREPPTKRARAAIVDAVLALYVT